MLLFGFRFNHMPPSASAFHFVVITQRFIAAIVILHQVTQRLGVLIPFSSIDPPDVSTLFWRPCCCATWLSCARFSHVVVFHPALRCFIIRLLYIALRVLSPLRDRCSAWSVYPLLLVLKYKHSNSRPPSFPSMCHSCHSSFELYRLGAEPWSLITRTRSSDFPI